MAEPRPKTTAPTEHTRSGWAGPARVALALYTCALLWLTHKPGLTVEPIGGFDRVDLVLHVVAFGGWTTLLALSRWFHPRALGPRNLLLSGGVGVLFGTANELSQHVVDRTVALSDLLANIGAAISATLALLALARVAPGSRDQTPHA